MLWCRNTDTSHTMTLEATRATSELEIGTEDIWQARPTIYNICSTVCMHTYVCMYVYTYIYIYITCIHTHINVARCKSHGRLRELLAESNLEGKRAPGTRPKGLRTKTSRTGLLYFSNLRLN